MYKHTKRTGYGFVVEDGEATITVLKALAGQNSKMGLYNVLYEDAHGTTQLDSMTIKEIASDYKLDIKDLKNIL